MFSKACQVALRHWKRTFSSYVNEGGKHTQEVLRVFEAKTTGELAAVKDHVAGVEARIMAALTCQQEASASALDAERAARAAQLDQAVERLRGCEDAIGVLSTEVQQCGELQRCTAAGLALAQQNCKEASDKAFAIEDQCGTLSQLLTRLQDDMRTASDEVAMWKPMDQRLAEVASTCQALAASVDDLRKDLTVADAGAEHTRAALCALEVKSSDEMTAARRDVAGVEARLMAELTRQLEATASATGAQQAAHAAQLEQAEKQLGQCEGAIAELRTEVQACAQEEELRASEDRGQALALALADELARNREDLRQELELQGQKVVATSTEKFAPRSTLERLQEEWNAALPGIHAQVGLREQAWDAVHRLTEMDKAREAQLRRLRWEVDELRAHRSKALVADLAASAPVLIGGYGGGRKTLIGTGPKSTA